jgi:hypothetical protein
MQKAIRKGGRLLSLGALEQRFRQYVWKRLLTVSPEVCWGILTQEVKALDDAYLVINEGAPPKQAKGLIFISKAVILPCLSKKGHDPDRLQNLVYDQQAGLNPETLAQEFRESGEYVAIPENAYDSHTWEGKKTKANLFKAEQAELEPFPPGLLDHLITG